MSTDPAQVRMDTIREQAAEYDEYDARMKTMLTTPLPERCRVCGSTAVEPHPRLPVERCGNCKEHRPAAAVDAAREDLAAEVAKLEAELETACYVARKNREHFNTISEVCEQQADELARVTAERDQARAMLARVRAKAAEWSAEPPWSDISWAPAGTWIVRMIDGEA